MGDARRHLAKRYKALPLRQKNFRLLLSADIGDCHSAQVEAAVRTPNSYGFQLGVKRSPVLLQQFDLAGFLGSRVEDAIEMNIESVRIRSGHKTRKRLVDEQSSFLFPGGRVAVRLDSRTTPLEFKVKYATGA